MKKESANEANSKPIILDLDTLEKMYTDRYKDTIKLEKATNCRMLEMEKRGVKKKKDKINSQPNPMNPQEHHTKTASSEQTTLLPGANVLVQDGKKWFPATVMKKAEESRSYTVITRNGHVVRRNRQLLKEILVSK